jgi:hypothetical protein
MEQEKGGKSGPNQGVHQRAHILERARSQHNRGCYDQSKQPNYPGDAGVNPSIPAKIETVPVPMRAEKTCKQLKPMI